MRRVAPAPVDVRGREQGPAKPLLAGEVQLLASVIESDTGELFEVGFSAGNKLSRCVLGLE